MKMLLFSLLADRDDFDVVCEYECESVMMSLRLCYVRVNMKLKAMWCPM